MQSISSIIEREPVCTSEEGYTSPYTEFSGQKLLGPKELGPAGTDIWRDPSGGIDLELADLASREVLSQGDELVIDLIQGIREKIPPSRRGLRRFNPTSYIGDQATFAMLTVFPAWLAVGPRSGDPQIDRIALSIVGGTSLGSLLASTIIRLVVRIKK